MPATRHLSILGIIIVAALVFAYEQTRPPGFAQSHGAVPSLIADACYALLDGQFNFRVIRELSRLATALFLHGDIEHILYNMVFLWVFGSLTSQYLGQWWAHDSTIALPIPRFAPVTRAVLPWISKFMRMFILYQAL